MITIKRILPILFALFVIGDTMAQQVWPVQLTGAMIPPRSLDLGVYGTDRPQDLFFNAMLNDPVEPSLQVRLELSIERNGEVLYITDPNYVAPPITLSQFQMMQIDGSMLRDYLNNANLVGAQNTGTGAIEIPEGFNQICLQVYGVDRNVPVSNKFCVQGSFVLNQTPQAIVPAFAELLEFPETQNQLFTWQPMHLGSSNSPGAVEYKFEMVQLPDGTYNANDAFESALQVYQTTTMTPSLIYTQAEPQLLPGKLYAWRVRAYPMMHPTSKLFQNDGYSEIYTFMYYEGEKPGLDITAFNNPSPTGCVVFNTDYGPISNLEPVSTPLVETDLVALGYFTMEITEATGGAQGFNGTGKVRVPMFNAYVNVEFTGLRVNSDMRVFEVGEVKAIVDQPFALDKTELQAEVVPTTVNENYVNELNDFFSIGDGVTRLTSSMNLADPTGYNLPIAMDQTDMPLVSVIGIYFTPRNAFFNLVSWKGEGGNDPMRFAATAVQATPYGVKNGSHLVALNEGAAESFEKVLESIELSRRITPDVKMDCDCEGAGPLESKASLNIAPEVAVREADKGVILLEPAKKGEVTERFVGEVKGIPDFLVNGIDDIVFSADKGFLNLSIPRWGEAWETGRGTAGDAERGLALTEASARIPEKFNFLNSEPIVLGNGSLFIDGDDVSKGDFFETNLLSIDQGLIEKWAYSIDTMSLRIKDSSTEGIAIHGQLKTPVFEETFPYVGYFYEGRHNRSMLEMDIVPGSYTMSLWYGQFDMAPESNVTLEVKNINGETTLYPRGSFSGTFSLNLPAEDVHDALLQLAKDEPELLGELRQSLEVDHLDLKIRDLELNNLELDPYAGLSEKYKLGTSENGIAQIGDVQFDIGYAELVHDPIDNTHERLGLKMHILHDEKDIAITLWADTYVDDLPFDFQGGGGESVVDWNKYRDLWQIVFEGDPKLTPKGIEISVDEGALCSCTGSGTGPLTEILGKVTDRTPFNKNEFIEKGWTSIKEVSNKLPLKIPSSDKLKIPEGAGLYITAIREGSVEISLLYALKDEQYGGEENPYYLVFSNNKVPVTNGRLCFDNIKLELQNRKVKEEKNRRPITFLQSVGSDSRKSYCVLDCKGGKGIESFYVHGVYVVPFEEGSGNNKLAQLIEDKLTGEEEKADLELGFLIDSSNKLEIGSEEIESRDLTDFVAKLNDGDWSFSLHNGPQLTFVPGEEFEGYLDFSETKSIPAKEGDGENYSWKGLVFRSIQFNVVDMAQSTYWDSEEEERVSTPLQKTVNDARYDFDEGLFANYYGTDLITKEDDSYFGKFKFILDTLMFSISYNTFDDTGVLFAGQTLIPIFEEEAMEISLADFSSGFVGIKGAILYDETDINIQSIVNSGVDSLFNSSVIPGLGMRLKEGSSVNFIYDRQKEEFEASCFLSGAAMLVISEEIQHKNSWMDPLVPDGIECILPFFSFEGLSINKDNESCGESFRGVQSLSFGTWGIQDNLAAIAGLTPGLQEMPVSIHAPKIYCEGDNVYKFSIGATINLKKSKKPSGGKTKKELEAAKADQQSADQAVEDARNNKPGDKWVEKVEEVLVTDSYMPPEGDIFYDLGGRARDAYRSTRIEKRTTRVKEKADLSGYYADIAEKQRLAYQAKKRVNDAQAELDAKKAKEPKTAELTATGEFNIVFGVINEKLKFQQVELNCLNIRGEYGPVKISGGLNILGNPLDEGKGAEESATALWGNGFKAYLDATVGNINVKAVGQFARKVVKDDNDVVEEDFRYFFIDLEGTSETGFKFPPSAPVAAIYGLGGGFRYNMEIMPSEMKAEFNNPPDNNDFCSAGSENPLLAAGVSLSGAKFIPANNSYGGFIKVIAGTSTPKTFVGDIALDIEIELVEGDLSWKRIGLRGDGYFLYDKVATRRTTNVANAYADFYYNFKTKVLGGDIGYQMNFENIILAPMPGEQTALSFDDMVDTGNREEIKKKKERGEKLKPEEERELATSPPVGEYNFGKLRFDFDKGDWEIKFGSWGRENSSIGQAKIAPPSGLKYNSHGILVPGVNAQLRLDGYFQAGHNVDPVPPLSYLIPFWNSAEFTSQTERPASEMKAGFGVAFGAKFSVDFSSSMGPFDAYLNAGIGGDFTLRKVDFECDGYDPDGGQVGINGWFARGQAYGYFGGGIDMNYDFAFMSGTVEILELKAFVGVQAQLMNPANFEGFLYGEYSVLDGLLEGKVNYEFQLGEKCKPIGGSDPVAGLEIVSEITPNKKQKDQGSGEGSSDTSWEKIKNRPERYGYNEQFLPGNILPSPGNTPPFMQISQASSLLVPGFYYPNAGLPVEPESEEELVSIFTTPEIITNISLNEPLSFPEYDKEGNFKHHVNYLPRLKSLTITKNPNSANSEIIEGYETTVKNDGYGLIITLDQILSPETEYSIKTEYIFQVKGEKGWEDYEGGTKIETDEAFFKTGKFPDEIKNKMLTQQAPGYNQRYWHDGYSEPMLQFKEDETIIDGVGEEIFKLTSEIGGKKVLNTFYLVVTKVAGNGEEEITYKVPIPTHPENATIVRKRIEYKNKGGIFRLPIIHESEEGVREVRYPAFNDIDLVKGAVYKMTFIREPDIELLSERQEGESITKTKEEDGFDYEVKFKKQEIDSEFREDVKKNTKAFYEYHFAVSQYDNLHDKLSNMKATYAKSEIARTDLMWQDNTSVETGQSWESNEIHATKDDYFRFEMKPTAPYPDEGIDTYDLDRIRKNAIVSYDPYFSLDKVEKELHDRLKGVLDGKARIKHVHSTQYYTKGSNDAFNQSTKNYLLERLQESISGGVVYPDGHGYGHDFSTPRDGEKFDKGGKTDYGYVLRKEEIDAGKLDNKTEKVNYAIDRPFKAKPPFNEWNVFKEEQTYQLLFQDYRSRVVLNRMRWIGKIFQKSYAAPNDWEYADLHLTHEYKTYHVAKSGGFLGFFQNKRSYFLEHEVTFQVYTWIFPPDEKDYPNAGIYNGHPGYSYSFSGNITIEFPKVKRWPDMISSFENQQFYDKVKFVLRPDRGREGDGKSFNSSDEPRSKEAIMRLVKNGDKYKIEGMHYDRVPDQVIVKDMFNNSIVAVWNYEDMALALFDSSNDNTLLKLNTPFPWSQSNLEADLKAWGEDNYESKKWGLSSLHGQILFIMKYKKGNEISIDGEKVNQIVATTK